MLRFDLDEAMRTGVFISGTSGYGKTNLAFHLARIMMRKGTKVLVFDPSQAWYKSSVPSIYRITDYKDFVKKGYPEADNIVYDLSILYVEQQKDVIKNIVKKEFMKAVNAKRRPNKVFVFEECQLLIPQGRLRSSEAQEILRLITVGRNFNLRFILLTQRPATVDKTCVSLCGQKYLGRVDELNDIRYLRNWIGNHVKKLPSLDVGQFIYDKGSETEIIKVPLFRSARKPRVKKRPSFLRRLFGKR